MYRHMLLPTLSAILKLASSAAVPSRDNATAGILKRQMNASSVCTTFGVDFQGGGSYLINSNSNESFTFVSKFEGCNDDLASLMLVNEDSSDQYDCGQVPTVPNNAPQLATCQVLKNQLVSGTYLIITTGNNGNGEPFSYQREFTLQVGPQQTFTVLPTVTSTTTPVVTTTSTTYVNYTSTVPNSLTITQPSATDVQTITPQQVTTTESQTITNTFDRWSRTFSVSTVTVTPTCHVPLRARNPDPICTLLPEDVRLPNGHNRIPPNIPPHAQGHVSSNPPIHPRENQPTLRKRAPDSCTTTITASSNGTTSTVTAPVSTQTHVVASTNTFSATSPPQTIREGKAVRTVTAPAPVQTVVKILYERAYVTKTFGWNWTQRAVETPAALAAECKAKGGSLESW